MRIRSFFIRVVAAVALITGMAVAGVHSDRLLLLVPDDMALTGPKIELWLDAASEEGLHIVPIHDSDFAGPLFEEPSAAGVIFPDLIHQKASDPFLAAVRRYVDGGGKLMLVYDAGTLSPEGRYSLRRARLSDLAGVDYALYDTLKEKTIQWSKVSGDAATVRGLGIPPGKYYPFQDPANPSSKNENFEVQLRRYKYGDLQYPSFVTTGAYSGKVLLHSDSGICAGEHEYGKGSVLFVNFPVSYLKSNTDGLLLHTFLRYFAERVLSLPYLMKVPDGTGGLVLNWHIDSNAAIRPLAELDSWTALQAQGPYSIHITAGPDDTAPGDHQGFDIEHNHLSQELVLHWVKLGNEIGSHGGWMHDYFAFHADSSNPAEIEPLLELNKHALEQVSGKPVVEYSAPSGTQPEWVTQWLEAHGFVAYYYTGNTGMGPTQGYRDGVREGQNIWSFPILHLDRAAAFEEMKRNGYSDEEVQHWLESVAEFATEHRMVRVVYFHPPGILPYKQVVLNWLETTARLKAEGRFRWYTMTQLANFLNSRKQVQWKISEEGKSVNLEAAHPDNLEHQTWWFPTDKFSKPSIVHGAATVVRDDNGWKVIAGKGIKLQIRAELVEP